jgi:hypothetical protein
MKRLPVADGEEPASGLHSAVPRRTAVDHFETVCDVGAGPAA